MINDNTCQICEIPIREEYSICDTCSSQVDSWNEDKDQYHMIDGRILRWNWKSELYE